MEVVGGRLGEKVTKDHLGAGSRGGAAWNMNQMYRDFGLINDQLQSIWIQGDITVTLFEGDNFKGWRYILTSSIPDLNHLIPKFSNKCSSFTVTKNQ